MRQLVFVVAVLFGVFHAGPVFAKERTYILHTPGVV